MTYPATFRTYINKHLELILPNMASVYLVHVLHYMSHMYTVQCLYVCDSTLYSILSHTYKHCTVSQSSLALCTVYICEM